MPNNTRKSKEEDQAVELQCLDTNPRGTFAHKCLDVEYAKAKHTRHGTVGHKEGEVPGREEEVDEETDGEEACPHDDVFVESLEGHAFLFGALFAGVGLQIL